MISFMFLTANCYSLFTFFFIRPMSTGPSYSTGAPSYNTGPGPQADMFSRRPGSAVPSGGYPPVGGG